MRLGMHLVAAAAITAVALLTAGRSAALTTRTVEIHGIESLFGVTPTIGAIGDGRLTAQIAQNDTIICMRWPNATFNEHIRFATGTFDDNPDSDARRQPFYGASERDGLFAVATWNDDQGRHTVPFRDADLQFAYAASTSNRLQTTADFGPLTIIASTFVPPDRPILVRTFRLVDAAPDVTDAAIIVYAAPALRNDPGPAYDPRAQTLDDAGPRFGAFAAADGGAILTAEPAWVPPSLQQSAATLADASPDVTTVSRWVEQTLTNDHPGTYWLQTAHPSPAAIQVGPITGDADTPYEDLLDGRLSGHPLALTAPATAMRIALASGAPAAWYGIFATTAARALTWTTLLGDLDPISLETFTDGWWAEWLRGTRLPARVDAHAFAYRTMISLRTGYDPDSGAIVASTSCNPPYNLDWPRDGAWFQYVLDLNDHLDEADRHARFYNDKNEGGRLYGPAGSWAMNYYTDGTPGGPIDFEIDQVGLTLWGWRTHAARLAAERRAEARRFIEDIRPSLQRAADLLVDCRHPDDQRLQCPANEDDNPPFEATLHGAITTWMGLNAAADMLQAIGDTEPATRYAARRDELAEAIRDHFDPAVTSAGVPLGALGWSFWPARFWRQGEAAVAAAEQQFRDALDRALLVDQEGTVYDTKLTIALLTPPLRSDATIAYVNDVHSVYLNDVLNPLLHLGEGTAHDDFDGDGQREWRNVTAIPHLWAQTLLYLSLLAADRPELVEPRPLPDLRRTGGCAAGAGDTASVAPVALALLLGLMLRRRPRTPARPPACGPSADASRSRARSH